MFTGRGRLGAAPQYPVPEVSMDFSQIPTINARDLFPEKPPVKDRGPRPYVAALMDALATPERDELLMKYIAVCEEAETFLAKTKSERLADLEAQLDAQWRECRRLETEISRHASEVGSLQGQANEKAMAVTKFGERLDAVQPPDTRFPTREELDEYEQRRAAIRQEIDNNHAAIGQLETFIRAQQSEIAALQKQLRSGIENLAVLRQNMEALKKD